jgi:hypothetical protein
MFVAGFKCVRGVVRSVSLPSVLIRPDLSVSGFRVRAISSRFVVNSIWCLFFVAKS